MRDAGREALMKLKAYLSTHTPCRNARNPRVTERMDEAGTITVCLHSGVAHGASVRERGHHVDVKSLEMADSPSSLNCKHDLVSSLLESWRNKEEALSRGKLLRKIRRTFLSKNDAASLHFYVHSCFLLGVAVTSLRLRSPDSYMEQKPRSFMIKRRWMQLQGREMYLEDST